MEWDEKIVGDALISRGQISNRVHWRNPITFRFLSNHYNVAWWYSSNEGRGGQDLVGWAVI